jgi:hypothetical protein
LPYDDTKVAATGPIWFDDFKRSIASSAELPGVQREFDSYTVSDYFFCSRTEPIYLKEIEYLPTDGRTDPEDLFMVRDHLKLPGYCQRLVFANGVSTERTPWLGKLCPYTGSEAEEEFETLELREDVKNFNTLRVNQALISSSTNPEDMTKFFVTLDVFFDSQCLAQIPFNGSYP